jgi:hypothetical protein
MRIGWTKLTVDGDVKSKQASDRNFIHTSMFVLSRVSEANSWLAVLAERFSRLALVTRW